MSRVSPPEIDESLIPASDGGTRDDSIVTRVGGLRSIRDRFRFKRNLSLTLPQTVGDELAPPQVSPSIDRPRLRNRWHQPAVLPSSAGGRTGHTVGGHHAAYHRRSFTLLPSFSGSRILYIMILLTVLAFAAATVLMQSSIAGGLFSGGGWDYPIRHQKDYLSWLRPGTSLRFVSTWRLRRVTKWGSNDGFRTSEVVKIGLRTPKLALILGGLTRDPQSLMLLTVIKNLRKIGYVIKIFASENVDSESTWGQVGELFSNVKSESQTLADWSGFDGIIAYSLDALKIVSSFMQEPFCSVPLVWIIQDDTLAQRLPTYDEMGWKTLYTQWKDAFERADVVVFPDFTLPMLYSDLDTGNFFVIPGTPAEVWEARSYAKAHSKDELRAAKGFNDNDVLVLVIGSVFFYDELPWDYAISMAALRPLLSRYAGKRESEGSIKFMLLCGNSSDDDAVQAVGSRYQLRPGSLMHHGINDDVNSLLLMSDIVLYGSSQDEQDFPPLVSRAMVFGRPIVAPDIPIFKKYIIDGVHGLLFPKNEPGGLLRCFSIIISEGQISESARNLAASGAHLVENVLAPEYVKSYAELLQDVLSFYSSANLPASENWDWDLTRLETNEFLHWENVSTRSSSIVGELEREMMSSSRTQISENETDSSASDFPSVLDWKVLQEIENAEEFDHVELEEIEQRMDKPIGLWDDIYRNARKSDKLNFLENERDEGELERTGQSLCIYEIYDGSGAWPFLHHGSLYRGLSLSAEGLRTTSDDLNAVSRLPLLNDTEFKHKICEIGGMFSVANKIDNVHSRPWIGFQSWRAAGRKVSLSSVAESVIEEKLHDNKNGNVIYFWVRLDAGDLTDRSNELTFWSICDLLNAGNCRTSFEDAFRHMYSLPRGVQALPPMPEDGGHWSAQHSWVMPTSSFLEFMMFSRMFLDSLDASQPDQTNQSSICHLASSVDQARHCYCRIMEILVNVWGYHSGRRMVYVDPESGHAEEQHRFELRKDVIWQKYFNLTLLKSMDEDLAEAADDGDFPRKKWLWPRTGEVHWQGIYEREREERYRIKMDKKRKYKEKLFQRMKSGYKQKPLG